MKRFLILIFMFLLCFAISCEKGEEKPVETTIDTPEVTEPAETPTETPEITEPVETPTETPEVVEPVETPEENIIILPEPDENTVTIEIAFPEDFPEEPYQEPNLVSPEEFEWGEYVPFVRYQDKRYGRFSYTYEYAFITPETLTLDEANSVYDHFNDEYAVSFEPQYGTFGICGDLSLEENQNVRDYLFKSHVIFASENLDKIGRIVFVFDDINDGKDLAYKKWNSNYDFIDNKKIVFTEEITNIEDFSDVMYHSSKKKYFYLSEEQKNFNLAKNENVIFTNENLVLTEVQSPQNVYHLYDVVKNKVITKFNLTSQDEHKYLSIQQIVDNRYLLLQCESTYSTENEVTKYYSSHYLYDLTTNKRTLLCSFAEEGALLSPDGNYLIYTAPKEKAQISFLSNNLENMKSGYYIKNLKNDETVFFESDDNDGQEQYIQNWVNIESLQKSIKK